MIFKTIDDNDSLSGQRIVSKFTARKIAQEEATKQLEIDIQCLRNYEVECQKGSVSTKTFSNTMKGASIEAQKYATNIKNGTGSAQTFATNQRTIQASMSETSIVSKVAATGLSIFKAALNSLIFFAVIEGIQLLIKGIDNLILTADEAEEKAEALRGNMQSFFDEVQSGQQTISSVSDRFSELSEHVTKTGENIDLTKNEYSEYLDICNQVKTIMPELVTGYTNEGNAIITLKDNVDNLTESYKENIRAKAAAFITNGDDDGNTIQSFFDDYKIFTEGENGLFAPSAGGLWNNKSTDYEDYYGYDKMHEWLEDVANLSLKDLQNLQKGTTQATYLYALLKENGYELANITEGNYEAVHDVLDTRLTSLEGEMATRVSNVKMSLQQMLYADRDYWDIDDKEALSAIDLMFSSIDSEFIKQNNLLGQDALQSFESNVVKLFEDKDTQKAMIDIYTPQGDDESIEDYSKRVNDAIKKVQNYAKDKKIDIPLDFTDATDNVEDIQKSYEDTINRFKDSNKIKDFFDTEGINTQEEIDTFNDVTKGITNADEAIKKWTEDKQNSDEVPISFTDTLAQVQALSDGLDQLDKIYADVYDKEDFDWSSILNNEDFKKQFGELGSVYDDFIKTIANSPSDLGACQSAFNKLTTEYINNSDVMKNLTEDTKAGTVAMLEQMGVANAEEMVEARLAAQKYATANGCIDLANATWEEISALIAEGNASQETQQYLANLALSKIDVNNIKLDTKADVDNIIAIANAAGASAAQIAALKTALSSLSNAKIDKWANSGGGMNSLNLLNPGKLNTPSSGNSKIDQFAKQQQAQKTKDAVQDATDTLAKTLDDIKNGAYNLDASNFYANYSGGSATSKAVNDAAKAAKDAAKDVKEAVAETFDFIENGINRFDKAFSKLEDKVDKTSSSFTSRLNAYKEALNAATFGIELLTDDYNKYMQKANEVGLNEDIASAVRGGASNIWDYSDDTVKQQIKDYQSWYDKAQDCLDKIDELKDKQLELTQASIELLITQYEKLSTKVENANDRMEKWISLKESWGFSANTKNYNSMNKNIQKQIDYINKQDEQLKLLQKTVTKGSEAWYEYNERIDSNKASLIDLKQQMQENATAAAELAKATADKKTEKYDSQDELYDAKIDNATSAKTKNKLINKKISNITKRQNIYNSVVTTDNKNLKSAKKTIGKFKSTKENKKVLASIKKAAKADKRISQSLLDKASKLNDNGKLYNACVQYNAYWDAKQSDKATADLYKETAKQDKADLAKEKFDNISSDYDNKISSNEQKKTALNNKISLAQEQGKQISAAYYKSLISSEKGEKNKLIKERKDLQKSLNDAVIKGSIKKGSDEWHEMVSAINEVTNAIDESTQSIVEYQNALRQLKWDAFDKSMETVKRINSENDYYIDLMSHKDMTDKDTGNFTKYGTATIGLHKTNYDNYLAQADEYQREYNKIMRQIEKGELSLSDENVIQRLRDLQDAHRDAKKSAEDELQSIQDLVKQGYEAQTDALSELIDKYKKLKDSELEAYKYQKEIAEKTKTIASLQKQLTAYNGNDSEESRAQIQKLKVQLEEAKSDLKDTQYEKFISDTEDMLDDLMTDYQKFIDEKLNDTNTILDEIKTLLGSDIIETIKGLDSNLTNDTKDQIGSSTTNGGDGGQAAKDYVHNTVTNDQNKVNSKTDTSSYDPAKEADIAKKKNGIAQKKKAINGQRQSFQNQIKELESQLKQLYGELNSIENKYQFEKSSTKNKDKLQDLKNNYIEKKSGLNAMIQDVTHNKDMLQQFIADLDKQSAQLDKDLASINGYEKGSEHIDKRQLAWTQENKRELIYRAADGALLTELNPGDKVFTNEMTENLWELAKTNPSLLYSSTNFVPKLPDIAKSAGTSTIVEVGDIVMNGVNDPETFGRQLREEICKNGKTTQCITEAVSAKQLKKNSIGNARLYK
nr:MAG TPA: chromosome segregation ATPase [Caudoviricetes sp.]